MGYSHIIAVGHQLVAATGLMAGWRNLILLVLPIILVSACGTQIKHLSAPRTYTVKNGDTLYGISWRYSLDYREVARWNGISSPYTIYAGKTLRLYPSAGAQRASTQQSASTSAKTSRQPVAARAPSAVVQRPLSTTKLTWLWPASGAITGFYSPTGNGRKGIDISGQSGQPVRAAASGKVVYSGDGLTGYGQLIIIKHNSEFLSAYAHNRKLLVQEEELVRGGQHIAELGSSGARQSMLHFEIRRNGKPVDPLGYLPNR